ncbi:MAG: ATP-binding protein [Candidatus Brocadiaceae bacterium]|nr:ATP-binding protein [Candidatus Brocadiaceae bacterium]
MEILEIILKKTLLSRNVLPGILKWLDVNEAVIVVGSRQVGKTSLLYMLIQHLVKDVKIKKENIFYLDLERMENLEILEAGPDALIDYIFEQNPSKDKKYVFIDEIQYLDNPSNLLKILVDHHSSKLKIFATGSSALTIKKKFKDSLVGRKITFEVFSLDFREYLNFKNLTNLIKILDQYNSLDNFKPISSISHNKILKAYFEYSIYGGYPAVVLLDELQMKRKYLDDIYTSYIRKDIKDVFSLDNVTAFNRMIKLLALNIGNLVNVNNFSKEIGIARQTIEKYFSILENTYICKFVQPYFTNKKKEVVKMPKVFFYDTGLRNRVINDFKKIEDRVDAGALIENVLFKNLLKRTENKENIKYWRMKYGLEVDFIIDEEQILPIEVKAGECNSLPVGISSFLKRYNCSRAMIANKNTLKETQKIMYIPYYLF